VSNEFCSNNKIKMFFFVFDKILKKMTNLSLIYKKIIEALLITI